MQQCIPVDGWIQLIVFPKNWKWVSEKNLCTFLFNFPQEKLKCIKKSNLDNQKSLYKRKVIDKTILEKIKFWRQTSLNFWKGSEKTHVLLSPLSVLVCSRSKILDSFQEKLICFIVRRLSTHRVFIKLLIWRKTKIKNFVCFRQVQWFRLKKFHSKKKGKGSLPRYSKCRSNLCEISGQ